MFNSYSNPFQTPLQDNDSQKAYISANRANIDKTENINTIRFLATWHLCWKTFFGHG